MNSVNCTGRVNTEITMSKREVGDEKYIFANFQLSIKRTYTREGKPTYDYIWCEAYQKQAEFIEKFIKKGVRVAITGWIKSEYYTNKGGGKGYSVKLAIEKIEIADSSKLKENEIDPGSYISSNVDLSGLEGAEYQTESPFT